MAVTNYYTVNNEIIGEHTAGSGRLDYLPDALGTIVAKVDQTLALRSTARYSPYSAALDVSDTVSQFNYAETQDNACSPEQMAETYITFTMADGTVLRKICGAAGQRKSESQYADLFTDTGDRYDNRQGRN